ncbi:hypothetical protein FPZ43_08405 [Mucilaginibacter pallidiroseus]|uniref:Uncharacterized protein n=1 Tax=Mucilaginibacter pallidiroseus TaxID=2599295 RepID=A0A563UF11_9SPHI|nr:hypothetical protein [Mucilaginibacter pallidiroseus]TWR29863.1 hypothetical protein FPZ43_08405 [Mucilaginibacter pallidiroseus]
MKHLTGILAMAIILSTSACSSSPKTGGAQADSGQTNIGNSGPADSALQEGKNSPPQAGTSGTDTGTTGNGAAKPTVDTTTSRP